MYTIYSTKYGQYYPGAYVQGFSSGIELPKHTKIIKAKFFFKNKKTGKVITKTSKNGGYAIKVNLVNGYIPYKVTVWYKDKTFKATTNKKGVATFKIKLSRKGTFKAKITFAGNKYYQKAAKTIKIKFK